MTDKRLNNLMILHVHKEKTDKMNLIEVANKFVEWKDNRNQIFGKFTKYDITPKSKVATVSTQTIA